MNKSFVEALDTYAKAFRDLVNERLSGGTKSTEELLRLNKKDDWGFICTSMDIVGDTSTGIQNFLQFGIDGPTRYENVGEGYLRLYGVLNAIYIQQQAIHSLYKLMNLPNPKDVKKKIDALRITEVRHKVGAHSVNYQNSDTQTIESFVPVRISLSGFNCEYINNENLITERVDLKDCLEKHLALMVDVLDKIYEKTVKTVYKSNKKKIEELNQKLHDLRIVRDGGVVMDLPGGTKLIIHTMRQ